MKKLFAIAVLLGLGVSVSGCATFNPKPKDIWIFTNDFENTELEPLSPIGNFGTISRKENVRKTIFYSANETPVKSNLVYLVVEFIDENGKEKRATANINESNIYNEITKGNFLAKELQVGQSVLIVQSKGTIIMLRPIMKNKK